MANMFSGNVEKKIPREFKECYKIDSITENLWLWCERLEKWGKILFYILIAIGIIDTIIAGINAHQFIESIGAETVEEIRKASAELGMEIPTVFEALVNNLFIWILYAFLEYCAYHVLALLVGSLASIVQHTKITANIALYNSAKDNMVQNIEEPSDKNHMGSDLIKKENPAPKVKKCTYCGKISPVSLGRCECGCLAFKDITHKWRCSECGEMISDDPCPNCGNKVNNE